MRIPPPVPSCALLCQAPKLQLPSKTSNTCSSKSALQGRFPGPPARSRRPCRDTVAGQADGVGSPKPRGGGSGYKLFLGCKGSSLACHSASWKNLRVFDTSMREHLSSCLKVQRTNCQTDRRTERVVARGSLCTSYSRDTVCPKPAKSSPHVLTFATQISWNVGLFRLWDSRKSTES